MDYSNNESLWTEHVLAFKKACRNKDFQQAKTIIDKAFGDAEQLAEIDTRIVWCVYSLASCYLSYGNNTEARQLYRKLIDLKERVLGNSRHKFLDDLEKLALLQANVGLGRWGSRLVVG
jgi:tetratricopeptide (TPR) repeat protein